MTVVITLWHNITEYWQQLKWVIDPVLSRFVPFDFFFHFDCSQIFVYWSSISWLSQLIACDFVSCHLVMWALCPFLSTLCMQMYWFEAFPAEMIGTNTFVVPNAYNGQGWSAHVSQWSKCRQMGSIWFYHDAFHKAKSHHHPWSPAFDPEWLMFFFF